MHTTHRTRPVRALAAAAALPLMLGLTACGSESESDTSSDTGSDTSSDTGSDSAAEISVEDPWVRATQGTDDPSMTAAFMAIDNTGDSDVELVSASSPVAGTAQLHEMAMVDGEMVMQEVAAGVPLAAGEGQLLQPGGMHIMLMDVSERLAPGDEIDLVLEFSDGSTQELTAPVKEFTEEEGTYHDHGSHDHGSHGNQDHGSHDHGSHDHGSHDQEEQDS